MKQEHFTPPVSVYLFSFIFIFQFINTHGQNTTVPHKNSGFLDFNGYYDTREFSVLTVNILAKLPHRLEYFSLTNFQSEPHSSDLKSFYSEQNIRWKINKKIPIDLTYQYVIRHGEENDDHRIGLRWKPSETFTRFFKKINMSYTINPMFAQFRVNKKSSYMTMIEHVYRIKILPKILKNKIYLSGFADQNFIYKNGKIAFEWVTEHQLGIRLIDQFFAIAEYRINTFMPERKQGLGYGLEYKIIF